MPVTMSWEHRFRFPQIPRSVWKQFHEAFMVLQNRESHKSRQVPNTLLETSERQVQQDGGALL